MFITTDEKILQFAKQIEGLKKESSENVVKSLKIDNINELMKIAIRQQEIIQEVKNLHTEIIKRYQHLTTNN